MAVKSLKWFFRESAIKKEVNTWSFEDCENYIQKHKKDSKQSNLLKKKINIVKNKQAFFINSANLVETAKYFKVSNDSNMKKILRGRISQLAKYSTPQDRKKAFSDWDYIDTTSCLTNSSPKQCNDNSHPKWNETCSFRNTGIYLWAQGYNVTRPLGSGGFGCVWECDGKAVKVMPDDYSAKTEIISAQKMAELINKDTSGKCKKYFNYLISTGENSAILEGILAHGDLAKAAHDRIESGVAETKKNTKKIDTLLRQLIQVGKSLLLLHKLGYSHNDVKPQNFLKVDKEIINVSKESKISKDGKIHKHRTQLADFGGISKIPQNKEEEEYEKQHARGLVCTPYFSPKNMNSEFTKEAIEKRDVFALGASGLEMLLSKIPTSIKRSEPRVIISKKNAAIYIEYRLQEYYGGTSQENMYNFLNVIRSMMDESYSSRPTLEEALALLKSVKSGN